MWPTSSEGSETERVRVIVSFGDGCVKVSNCAPNILFAWETGRVIDHHSPLGEMGAVLRLFADAKPVMADTVSGEGWTKILTLHGD
jgi:hypothetical protein